jgi:hypothetical protein
MRYRLEYNGIYAAFQPTRLCSFGYLKINSASTRLQLERCRGITYPTVWLLFGATRPRARLREVLPQLLCQACHDQPAAAALIENPTGRAQGGSSGGRPIRLD